MIDMITVEQRKIIKNVFEKVDREADYNDLASLFGFRVETPKQEDTGGTYDFRNKIININSEYANDEDDCYEIFFHEFGHLIHEAADTTDFYNHYNRYNKRLSELLVSER